jgi:tetratricopeptide (TPR) repeat protein
MVFEKKNYFCNAKYAKMLENISSDKLKEEFKNNSNLRTITFIVGGLIVFVLGFFLYKQFVSKPNAEKSKASYYEGLNYAAKDSSDLAITNLKKSVDKFDGHVGGEVAQFVLARQYMAKGEFKKAIDELKSVDLSDTYVSVMAIGLQGDCYSELKDYPKAADLYVKAAEMRDNEYTSPAYLFKAGLCAEESKDFEAAKTIYQKIIDNYPTFSDSKRIKKYLGRVTKTVK